MARVHRRPLWDTDRGDVTPEPVYASRRDFLKSIGAVGIGAAGMSLAGNRPARADANTAADLRRTLRPVPGSAFAACERNATYTVDRPLTDELVAARYNNFYEFGTDKEACWRQAQKLTVRPWTIEITGLVARPQTVAIDDLIRKMPCEERRYRFRCVERWAMVVPWSGFRFKALMDRVEPLGSAKYVRFVSFHRPEEAIGQRPGSPWTWPYYEGLRIDEAANEMTFVATGLYGHDIPKQHGAPFRMVVPWKYGYKGAKSVVKIEFTDEQPATFWNDARPDEYGFYSNVNPDKPHPRWSQKRERMIGSNREYDTRLYNGYEQYVGHLYTGAEH